MRPPPRFEGAAAAGIDSANVCKGGKPSLQAQGGNDLDKDLQSIQEVRDLLGQAGRRSAPWNA